MRRLRIFTFLILLLSALSAGYFAYRQYRETDLEGPALQVPDGVLEVSIYAEDSELLQGVTAEDARDGDVTDSLVIEGVSDFMDDRRIVTYAAFDRDHNVGKASRQIRYTDYESPRFHLDTPFAFPMGYDTNFLSGIHAQDCMDGDITDAICLSKGYSLYSDVAGEYPIQFEVSNSAGDTALLPVTVTIYDPAEYSRQPRILLENYILYLSPGEKPSLRNNISEVEYHGEDLDDKVIIDDSQVDYQNPGTYEAVYSLEGEDGYTGSVRLVIVVRKEGDRQ